MDTDSLYTDRIFFKVEYQLFWGSFVFVLWVF